jgi:hypothetical protein
LLERGAGEHIPIVGTIVGVAKLGANVRDRLFTKKLIECLGPFASVPSEARQEMVQRLERDPQYGRRVGEHLIELIDRIEMTRKPKMISAVFLAYLQSRIDATMLHRLNYAVERIPVHEITALREFCDKKPEERDSSVLTLQTLQVAGLLNSQSAWGGLVYEPNEVAGQFLRLELDRLA